MSPSAITISNNPLLLTYAACAVALCIKIQIMSFLTAIQRFKKRVFANPEDTVGVDKAKMKHDDPDVERVRRAHLNDLENIPIFLVVSFLYVTIGQPADLPSVTLGKALLMLFTAARIVHTLVYAVVVVPQPARGMAFGVGTLITLYMAVSTLLRICALQA